MLQAPKWKLYTIFVICLLSIYLALPSLFPSVNSPILTSNKMNLGLDLKGGAYLLLELDFDSYEKEQLQKSLDQVRAKLRLNKIDSMEFSTVNNQISFAVRNMDQLDAAEKSVYEALGSTVYVKRNSNSLIAEQNKETVTAMRNDLIGQSLEIIRRRIDETGTKEVDLQRQGDNYILLQVPGAENPEEIKRLLGKTAKLSFNLVEDFVNADASFDGRLNLGTKILPLEDKTGTGQKMFVIVQSRSIISGEMLVDAQATVQYGAPVVQFRLNTLGAKLFGDVTSKNAGKQLAIVLDNKVISAPNINEPILGGSGIISGNFTIQSANELALLLRAGALPVPLKIAEERTVGPSLGQDSIEAGTKAALLGTVLILVFMFLFYGVFGMIANVALMINLFMAISILSLFGATLTLPGIAGMVLTLGMAVDANVLIFERIKEEARKGRTPLAAIESGFSLAFHTILDSNLTTVLAGVILYLFGNGPIRGFAVTLTVGIICSMFTAITLSKLLIAWWYRRNRPQVLPL